MSALGRFRSVRKYTDEGQEPTQAGVRKMKGIRKTLLFVLVAGCISPPIQPPPELPGPVKHVIHISVDGLRSDAITTLGRQSVPNFFRLRDEGAFTDNARTDPEIANTLPDHASELTSRPIFGFEGHGWLINEDPGSPSTLHLLKGEYVPSVFDVVHDSGFSTALYANKRKFDVFDRTWNELFGARDQTGADNGRDKIDTGFIDGDMPTVAREFVTDMGNSDYTYAFLHFRHPDTTGHASNWDLTPGSNYLNAVVDVDGFLGDILALVQSDPELLDTTALIVTADHAGDLGLDIHLLLPELGLIDSGIIPFYVWGVSIAAGVDLYELNPNTRLDPARSIPSMSAPVQPIRNGDAGNLALQLLGLPVIPNSTINASQDLAVSFTP